MLRSYATALGIALAFTALGPPTTSRADEASGTWTGRVEVRGSYYWERSTRVVAPTIGGRLDAPNGMSVQAYYLVDSITSASVAAGALVDVGFREIRNEVGATVSGEIDVGEQHLAMTGGTRFSREPDYRSYTGNAAFRLAVDQRNTVIGLNLSYLHDEVRQVFRTGSQIRPPAAGTFDEDFDGVVLALYAEHLVNDRLQLAGGYDLVLLRGYLASPYRQVQIGGILEPESHPDTRNRHTLWTRAQVAVPEAHGALHAMVRGYADSWDIRAITVETRWYQSIGEHLLVRLRHRYYAQTASFFDSGHALPTYTDSPRYFTADPKMERFYDNEVGAAIITRLGFFGDSSLDWIAGAEIEFAFDYRFSTNRFGDAIFAAMVLRMPFD